MGSGPSSPRRLCPPRAIVTAGAAALIALGAHAAAGEHPRLLMTSADLPRIRLLAGIAEPPPAKNVASLPVQSRPTGPAAPADPGAASGGGGSAVDMHFGALAADYQALRAHLAKPVGEQPLPGELLASAFLHRIDPSDARDAERLRRISAWIEHPDPLMTDPLAVPIALDWCWADIAPPTRREVLLRVREEPQPLNATDSPLRHAAFRQKLAHLAYAIAFDAQDDPSPAWLDVRKNLLEAGRDYFRETFPRFCKLRGAAPSSPSAAADEECDAAFALELATALQYLDVPAGAAARPQSATAAWGDAAVSGWLEHYVYATLDHPALQHDFIRDDGDTAPLTPCPNWDDLTPLTAHLFALRTGNPAAGWLAERVDWQLRRDNPAAVPWRFVPLLLDARRVPRLDARLDQAKLSLARNFGSAVAFRAGRGLDAVAIWIETPPVFLRGRQHFDAGHFLIHAGGHLVVAGGDDVATQASPAKGGKQRVGVDESFDFEQYCISTIAHNCLLFWEGGRSPTWRGQRFRPIGGQRLLEGDCTDLATPAELHSRRVCRQLAFGQTDDTAYLALDLLPAYSTGSAAAYTREFLFLWGCILIVVDRVEMGDSQATPVWILNLPARPTVDDADLPADARLTGTTNDGGVWRVKDGARIGWKERDGSILLQSIAPESARVRIVGGPANRLPIENGDYRGKSYVGGDPNSFERLVIPSSRQNPLNAWYRLGTPTVLGPQFGVMPHWGRIEVEPAKRGGKQLFVHVLRITPSAEAKHDVSTCELAPAVAGQSKLILECIPAKHRASGVQRRTIEIDIDQRGGRMQLRDKEEWEFPGTIEPNAPLTPR